MAHQTLKNGGSRLPRQTEEKRKKNPIDNEQFHKELTEYLTLRVKAVATLNEIPQIPNCIGSKLYMIADMLSKKYYFIGYSYRDEMVSDAIINCILYIDKFDPSRGTSAFAYFTQICFYAFVRRIQTEKRQSYVKSQVVKNLGSLFDEMSIQAADFGEDFHSIASDILINQGDESLEQLFGKKTKIKKDKEYTHSNFFDLIEDPRSSTDIVPV